MEESFLNKINTSWNKGWNSNPNYAKAERFISIVARGEENKDENRKKELDELEI